MATSRFSSDVLQLFCGLTWQGENRRQKKGHVREIRGFLLARNDFPGWPRLSKMDVPSRLPVERRISAISREKQKQGLLV